MPADPVPPTPTTAVVVGGPPSLAQACATELEAVLGAGTTVVQVPVGPGDEDGTDLVARVLGLGSPEAPLGWVVVLAVHRARPEPLPVAEDDGSERASHALSNLVERAAAALAATGGGRVVAVVDAPDRRPGAVGAAARAATAAALVGRARSTARSVADQQVTVNVVQVGLIATAELEQAVAADSVLAGQVEALARSVPMRRLVTLDDVAAAVGHLVSEPAGYVNGIVLPIEGGAAFGAGT
ncbi:SDR family oxidoreductase [Aquihabitans daechungensis]|uniref:SDR family oxidoreductase n=1 Tax=Aquihabitans daechungensis TaxID=1052257 RepID=UPI003BA25D82